MTKEIKYIAKVEISRLWNKSNISWDLNNDVNILSGTNGSGKTTILDFICGLISTGTIPSIHLGLAEKIKLIFNNKKFIDYEHIKINDSIKNIEQKANNGDYKCKEIISTLKEEEGSDYKRIKSIKAENHWVSFKNLEITLDELNKILNIDVISTFDNSLKQSEAIKKLSDNAVRTELDWEIYNLQKKYLDYQLNISKRKDNLIEKSQKDVKKQFEILKYPQNRFLEIIDESFSETGKKINRNKNQIDFLLDEKEQISPFQLSSGEKQLLIILLTTLIQDNQPSVLFMDEPEISLHIEWQKKLIQHIRELNPNVQLIIATHSPALIMEGWQDKVFEVSDLLEKMAEK